MCIYLPFTFFVQFPFSTTASITSRPQTVHLSLNMKAIIDTVNSLAHVATAHKKAQTGMLLLYSQS